MAKDLEMGYLLDFYGEVLTEKQREMLRQYYNTLFPYTTLFRDRKSVV